ncbi:xanthine dehydrogenase family protein molybdopterin-binding subunit [Acetomicrobium sp. UBA5826]|uniref:xanthine dehydrogenase family protein molybdopterin-binding subunit n=1 Tax=Acetomicrobium sp. UBA5826 TaxID=1946039 RepID=UPI0025801DD3|nr:xanthine dehydrogenase family protein molybdopterin-binding subunit [Acetomicrobium sp. UBA5826]
MQTREEKIISGKGIYVDDIVMPNMAYCLFVGSAYAHANIKKIDLQQALSLPGIITILTGKEILEAMNPLPPTFGSSDWLWRTPIVYPLVLDKARFYGEPIAAVIAESPDIASDAANLIDIEYDPLEPVVDLTKAIEPASPLLYEEWGDNIQIHKKVEFGDVQRSFEEADRILKVSWRENRASGFPIEARGCVAFYDKMTEILNVWSSTQSPSRAQYYLAQALKLPMTRVKITMADVGGGFGNKLNWWKETVVALAAILIGRPVKWVESKREFIVTGPHQRDVLWKGEVAIKNDGTILGIRAKLLVDLGVESTCREGAARTLAPACQAIPNAYHLKGLEVDVYGVVTNKSFYGAYRGFGKDKGIKFMERIVQMTARELHMDPVQIRKKNLIQKEEFPYEQITGYVYDSGNYEALLEKALELGNLPYWEKEKQKRREQDRYLGVGIGITVEPAGLGTSTNALTMARVRMTPDGLIEVEAGQPDIGQGSTITRRKIAADILGVKMDHIEVKRDNSDMVFTAVFSSRGAVYPTSALAKAAKLLRQRIISFAADFLNESPSNLDIKESVVYSKTSHKEITFKELARKAYFSPGPIGLGTEKKINHEVVLDVSATWFSPNTARHPKSTYTTFCAGVDLVVLEIDKHTGQVNILKYVHVHDAGTVIDENIVDGQIYGGIMQGIGEALYEELVYNQKGELLSNSYSDYLIPTTLDSPNVIVEHLCTPSPFTELGTKGMGEAPIIGSKVAVINAIEDALSPLGIVVTESPATPERIRGWILESKEEVE